MAYSIVKLAYSIKKKSEWGNEIKGKKGESMKAKVSQEEERTMKTWKRLRVKRCSDGWVD